MQTYKTLPPVGSLTIEEAMQAAKKSISIPGRNILIAGFMVGIGLVICGLPFWVAPLFIFSGILLSSLYAFWITPKWRIWAYSGVRDIHQLQRNAELESILPKNSPMIPYGMMSRQERLLLSVLQDRFLEETTFVDDLTGDDLSKIYKRGSDRQEPQITISYFGITTPEHGFYSWDNVRDEQVVIKSFLRMNGMGVDVPAGNKAFLTFFCPDDYISIALQDLDITTAQLDTMLYIHRGRYEVGTA